MAELLRNAADLSQANAEFMVSWALRGIIGLLLAYTFMYFGGMLGHTAAYRTLYESVCGYRNISANFLWDGFNRNAIGKVKQIADRM